MHGSTTNAAFSEYIYFDGKRAARRDYQSNVFYYFADQVGSARGMFEVLAGSHTASPPCFDADFYPFGGEHDFTNTCPQNYKFMGKERDSETNNDDFGARSYASAYGRFLSADWSSTPTPVPYANLTNPQTLNLYAMVSDNPESFADLDGHDQQSQNSASSAGDCATKGSGSAAACPAQSAGTAQSQSAQSQLVVTMKITEPTVPIARNQTETVADFGVARMDAKGKIVPTDEEHSLKMTETVDKEKSKGKTPETCSEQCTGTLQPTHTVKDTMRVSGNQIVVLDKRFQIDGRDAKVVDPGTGRPHDFVHQVSSVKGGTSLTFGDNSSN